MPEWRGRRNGRRQLIWPPEALPYLSNLYDGEIAITDEYFRRLLERLKELELFDDLLLIFTSDHGEEFEEHGDSYHGYNLHAETLDIPLIIKFPGQRRGRRVELLARHVDIMPTILDVAGLEVPPGVEGRSLVGYGRKERGAVPRPAYSHLRLNTPDMRSVVLDGWKYIQVDGQGGVTGQLFNRREDPGETDDLADEFPIRAAVLAALIERKSLADEGRQPVEEIVLDRRTERQLRALGYLE